MSDYLKTGSGSIYIYGDLVSDAWTGSGVSAKKFVDALNSFGDSDVEVHINSGGGCVFEALAIFNAIKFYAGNVTVIVDGLAASAASLITCGADKVVMAKNALMMLHMPSVVCCGFYDKADLDKLSEQLAAIENSVVESYQDRLALVDLQVQPDILTLLKAETWLTAADALKYGFADEIADNSVDIAVDDETLIVDKIQVDLKRFDETKLRKALNVESKISAPKIPDLLNRARMAERNRIQSLMSLRGQNSATDAVIEVALESGKTVDEIQPYLDALKNVSTGDIAQEKFTAVIRDQMNSGAEKVTGSQEVDGFTEQQRLLLKHANGGKKHVRTNS